MAQALINNLFQRKPSDTVEQSTQNKYLCNEMYLEEASCIKCIMEVRIKTINYGYESHAAS